MSDLGVTRGTGTTGYRIPSPFGSVGRRRRIPDRSRTIREVCAHRSREPLPRNTGIPVRGLRASPRHTASPLSLCPPRPPHWLARLLCHRLTVALGELPSIQHPSTTRPQPAGPARLVIVSAVGCGLEDHSEDRAYPDEGGEHCEGVGSDPQHKSDRHSGSHSDGERQHGRWGVLDGHLYEELHLRPSLKGRDRAVSRRSHEHCPRLPIGGDVRCVWWWLGSIGPVGLWGGEHDRRRMSVRGSSADPRRRPVMSIGVAAGGLVRLLRFSLVVVGVLAASGLMVLVGSPRLQAGEGRGRSRNLN